MLCYAMVCYGLPGRDSSAMHPPTTSFNQPCIIHVHVHVGVAMYSNMDSWVDDTERVAS